MGTLAEFCNFDESSPKSESTPKINEAQPHALLKTFAKNEKSFHYTEKYSQLRSSLNTRTSYPHEIALRHVGVKNHRCLSRNKHAVDNTSLLDAYNIELYHAYDASYESTKSQATDLRP